MAFTQSPSLLSNNHKGLNNYFSIYGVSMFTIIFFVFLLLFLVPLLVDYFTELQDDHSRLFNQSKQSIRASVVGAQEMPLLYSETLVKRHSHSNSLLYALHYLAYKTNIYIFIIWNSELFWMIQLKDILFCSFQIQYSSLLHSVSRGNLSDCWRRLGNHSCFGGICFHS